MVVDMDVLLRLVRNVASKITPNDAVPNGPELGVKGLFDMVGDFPFHPTLFKRLGSDLLRH